MNITLKLEIPLINTEGIEKNIKIDSSLFLTPYYAVEEDIVTTFPNFVETDLPVLRKMLFDASLRVYNYTERIEKLKILTDKMLFAFRRDYVICLVTNEMAKRLNANNVKSQSKSKSLGDFSVATTEVSDTTILSKIFSDSQNCITDIQNIIKEAEQDLIVPASFVKGRFNTSNLQANDRLWWLKDLDGGSRVVDGYASNKFSYNGNMYKAASLNRASISGGMTPIDYYRRGNEE